VVSTLPAEIYREMAPADRTPYLESIRYTALISMVGVTRQRIEPDFYWMNLTSLDTSACAVFMLNSLNPTIGDEGERCINLVTHLPNRHHEFFQRSDEDVLAAFAKDFRRIFGFDFQPLWTRVGRAPTYSPVFVRGYHNPPVRSATWRNVYFAGNYRTFPSVASTGTGMNSGFEAAEAILGDLGGGPGLLRSANDFRLRSMPRG